MVRIVAVMPILDLDRAGLFYTESSGTAEPAPTLLLVHGWGGAGDQWCTLLPHLASATTGRVLVPDLRGHGASRSQWTDEDWRSGTVRAADFTPRAFAADLARLLTELRAGPVIAVGHSMGGQVVTALAVEHPSSVSALVVLDPAYGADDAELARIPGEQDALRTEGSAWAARFVANAFATHVGPGMREREQRLMAATDARVLAAAREGMYLAPDAFGARAAAAAYLARCAAPTLAIYSNTPAADWHRADAPRHPGSVVEVIPDVGHYLQLENPWAVADLINRFVARIAEPDEAARQPRSGPSRSARPVR
jgi:pimeloyl-ACP methyl ester carboxylesterase